MSVATIERERQRMAALREANAVRKRRARLKLLIAKGYVSVSYVLSRDYVHLHTMTLRDLLLAVPVLGTVKVDQALRKLHFGHGTTLENVTMERRKELLAYLARRYPRAKL